MMVGRAGRDADAPCKQEVALVERRKLDPDENLVRARSLGRGNVDILKTLDRVAISRELNSAHIDYLLKYSLRVLESTF
jgi:hypothetical protein